MTALGAERDLTRHTWTQRLRLHFHAHCIVPGGVWREASQEWVACRGTWLFRQDSLGDAFRNRFLQRLCALRKRGKLAYGGRAAALAADSAWEPWLATLAAQSWIVFPKPTPADPTQALDYVARYTHKVAIADSRIKAIRAPSASSGQAARVTYTWRDRSQQNIEKTETIPAALFTRRFLSHILPDGFHKIRYFGWMAAVHRKETLAAIRKAIHAQPPPEPAKETLAERVLRRTGVDITLCPHCGKGHLQRIGRFMALHRGQSP